MDAFRARLRGEGGFTLVELLTVTIIIGALAAIALPFFLNQRQKAFASQAHSALKDANTAAQAYGNDNNGNYSAVDLAALEDEGYNPTDNVILEVTGAGRTYCIRALHLDLSATSEWKLAVIGSAIHAPSDADAC